MRKKMTKQQKRNDMKEDIFNLIKLNSEDGCTMKDVMDHCSNDELGRTRALGFLRELQIDGRIREVNFHRFKVYKVVIK